MAAGYEDEEPPTSAGERRPAGPGLTRERVFALVATTALLGVGLAAVVMVASTGGDGGEVASAPAPVRSPTPTATPTPSRPRLTSAQRAERRAAAEQVRAAGFEPVSLSSWRPDRTLRVLIGRRSGAAGGGRRAFFFVDGRFVGTDTADASGRVRVARNGETTVTLLYTLYAPGDKACCPSAGSARVRLRWTGSALVPEEAIPPLEQRIPQAGA